MGLNFLPTGQPEVKPRVTVVGVGGAGGNAVNNMIQSHLEGVDFVVANTDAQALAQSRTDRRVQLGGAGLGAGAKPDVGRLSAEETIDEIISQIDGSNMVFITAGMGGGTGTGAAPVIARMAKERGILTVGVVTKPFHFEGAHRMRTAEAGIAELQQFVDTLIVIPNQNLFRIATERTTFADAFRMADDVLHSGVRGVTDLMMMPGLINLDYSDIRTVMSEMGKAMMGTGEAEGEKRSIRAAESAISNPLLDDTSMKGAKGVLINITGGPDLTLFEVDEAANRIRDEVDPDANIIFGAIFDDKLAGRIRVSVVATGIEREVAAQPRPKIVAVSSAPAKTETLAAAPAPQPAQVAARTNIQGRETGDHGAVPSFVATPAFIPAAAQAQPSHQTHASQNQPVVQARTVSQPQSLAQPANHAFHGQAALARTEPAPQPAPHQTPAHQPQTHQSPIHQERAEPQFGNRFSATTEADVRRNEPRFEAPTRAAAAPAPQPVAEQPRRAPSLFERMAAVRNRQAQPAAEPAPRESQQREPAQREPSMARPEPTASYPSTNPQPQAGRNERPNLTNVRSADVDLDIPAFLRRQAN